MKLPLKTKILYAPLDLLLHLVALLPFWLLYAISDFIYFIMFYVVKYRKRVVRENIRSSFPEKTEEQHAKIVRDFYHSLSDRFVEIIKLLHISDKEMKRRMVFKNIDINLESVNNNRSMVVYVAHFCNWEWLSSESLWIENHKQRLVLGQIYRPLKNKWFDNFFLKLRDRFNTVSYPKSNVVRHLIKAKQDGKITTTGFIADQHPSINDQDCVIRFLNHDTAFITGPEVLAKKLDMDVMMFYVTKIKRGHYQCELRLITRTPKELPQHEITKRYARLLEQRINEQPEQWLWTHKRWKHKVNPSTPVIY